MIKLALASATMLGAALLFSGAAEAQKSKDTIRIPFVRQISTVDPYTETGSPNRFMAQNVHDNLVEYDETANKVVPLLAKSWSQPDAKTIEFELRDDVKWQDGQKFDADDVVYMLNWLIDPKSDLRNRDTWAWISKVEKLGPYKVRITADQPAPWYLTRLAFETYIYPEHIHKPMADKKAYGRFGNTPIGTGPYKYTQFDRDGMRLTKNPDYKHGNPAKPAASIGNVYFKQVPDVQTQMAGFLVGDWDMLTDPSSDQARDLVAKDPKRFELTSSAVMGVVFATLDANGVTDNKVFKDPRVRKAFFMGVDRKELHDLYTAGQQMGFSTENHCFKFMAGCDFTDGLIKYDPAQAKKLLAEAGYPNGGIDVEITTVANTFVAELAKAMAGQLRRVGFNVTIDQMTFPLMYKKEREGKTTIRMSVQSPRIPDTSGMNAFFWGDPDAPHNKYFFDAEVSRLAHASDVEMDPVKRKALTKQQLDRNAEQALVLPVTSMAVNFPHTREVKFLTHGRLEINGYYLYDLAWN